MTKRPTLLQALLMARTMISNDAKRDERRGNFEDAAYTRERLAEIDAALEYAKETS